MSEWKCGKCGKIYTLDELLKLKQIKTVESDTNPSEEHGFTSMCDCGYRFHLDRWRLNDDVEIKTDEGYISVTISTIDLELNHGFGEGENIWYETMVFPGGFGNDESEWLKCNYRAIKDHNMIVNLLKEGKYEIKDSSNDKEELILLEEKDN